MEAGNLTTAEIIICIAKIHIFLYQPSWGKWTRGMKVETFEVSSQIMHDIIKHNNKYFSEDQDQESPKALTMIIARYVTTNLTLSIKDS